VEFRLVGIALFQAFEEMVDGHAHGRLPGVLLRRAMKVAGL